MFSLCFIRGQNNFCSLFRSPSQKNERTLQQGLERSFVQVFGSRPEAEAERCLRSGGGSRWHLEDCRLGAVGGAHEFLEHLHVEGRSGVIFRVPLYAKTEPFRIG